MSQKYFFIRHGQLVEPYLDHLTMDHKTLTDLSTSELDPGINKNAEELFKLQTKNFDFSSVELIYYNDSGYQSQRSKESAELIKKTLSVQLNKDISITGLPDLKEVRFNTSELLTEEEHKNQGMPIVRTRLYKAMNNGTGATEQVSEINDRISIIEDIIKKHELAGDILFVTHDFFMRLIELFIKKPDRLSNVGTDDLESTSLNHYFGGFVTDKEMRSFNKWGNKIT